MAVSLLKPKDEKPAVIRFSCSQALAARLKNLEQRAAQRGVQVDVNAPLAAALERLIDKAEKALAAAENPGLQRGSASTDDGAA